MDSQHIDGPVPPAVATALLRIIVRVALADGQYVPQEATLVDEFPRRFRIDARLTQSIVRDERLRPSMASSLASAITTNSLRSQIVQACMKLARADGDVHPSETAFVRYLCDAWDMKLDERL
jgi:uncharacterized tellurite resistance protein B-like protein